jgi:hypothetical protein
MNPPPFPQIPGVQFKEVPGYPGYAVSSDGRAWNGRGRKWRVMETFTNFLGPKCVWLRRETPLQGAKVHNVEELVLKLFPQQEND